ncbi:sensor histidine kinase [Magnetospirillum sp. UT-4]|uniref:sensor histidine kinase n=1 Tax=Magnetospirillum sp. UT-4 TaxID=2681467 RepID=UPI0013834C5B|nr:histidine kinase dimerization/phosphoacceptor domain -containing protein [Magnetospirillum sp. UT-4]CAA7620563.1 conserved exported hypothetical protein [Magnetospirillum sp. UT-4]
MRVISVPFAARHRAWTLILLLLATCAAALGYGAWSDFRAARVQAEFELRDMAGVVGQHAGAQLVAAMNLLREFEHHLLMEGDGALPGRAGLAAALARMKAGLPEGRRLWVADAAGTVLAGTLQADEAVSVADQPYFQAARSGQEMHIGALALGRLSGQPVVTVGRRIAGADGTFLGVVAMALPPETLTDIVHTLHMGRGSMVTVVGTDGMVIARHPLPAERLAAANGPLRAAFPMSDLAARPIGTVTYVCPVDGVERLVAYRKFAAMPMVAIVGRPLADIRQAWRADQTRMVLSLSPLIMAVLGLVWLTLRGFRHEAGATTALVRALADREVLLAEVHHRVKNNLQIVQSLLTMEALSAPTPCRGGYEESQGRLVAMGMVHELLYASGEFGRVGCRTYLERLCALLLRDRPEIAFGIDGSAGDIDVDRAVPFAMAVNEMISNCLKHAFPDQRPGRLRIGLERSGGEIVVSVADNGPGLPAGFDPEKGGNMGLRLLRGLAAQLGGSVAFASGAGTTVTLRFPSVCGAATP